MNYITEPAKQVHVVEEVDICVIGGSCTGVFAAVRAAKLGAKVAIIENNGFFGGVATAGLVNIWHSLDDVGYNRQITGGLTHQMIEVLKKQSNVIHEEGKPCREWILNSPELVIELDKLIVENNITPYLHTKFVDCVADGNDVQAILIENKNGRGAIKAKYFVDASGDADLARRTGFEFTRETALQPPTACAVYSNLNEIMKSNPLVTLEFTVAY